MTTKTKTVLKTAGLISLICLLTGVLIVNIIINSKGTGSITSSGTSSEDMKTVYRLSEHDGKLAVYILGDSEPMRVYDLFLTSLPSADADMLKDGILVYDNASLQQLIEDYTS